jgi:hypothetical protein
MFRVRAVLAALVAGCLLVACSDDDPEPKVADPTPSAAHTSSTAPTAPSTGAIRDPESTLGAWVAAQNEALATGSTAALRALEADECQGCADFPDAIDETYNAGGSYEGGAWKLVNSHVEASSDSTANLTAAIRIAGGTTIPKAGADPVHYDPQNHLMSFGMVVEGGEWRFTAIAFIS